MINIGVIGYGYWGPNLVRNIFEVPDTQVVAVSDMNKDRLAHCQQSVSLSRGDDRPQRSSRQSHN